MNKAHSISCSASVRVNIILPLPYHILRDVLFYLNGVCCCNFFSVKCVRQTTRRALYVWEVIFLCCFSVCFFSVRLKLPLAWRSLLGCFFVAFVYMCAALNFTYLIFQHDKTKYKMPIRAIPRMPTIHTCTCRYTALPYYILHTNSAQRESSHPICYVSVESHLHRSMLWQTPTMQCHCLLNTFFLCQPATLSSQSHSASLYMFDCCVSSSLLGRLLS